MSTGMVERRHKRRAGRRALLLLLLLLLMLGAIFSCAQIGWLTVRPSRINVVIGPPATADYGPWPREQFRPIDPLLGTLVSLEDATAQSVTAIAMLADSPTPQGDRATRTVVLSATQSVAATSTPSPTEAPATATLTATREPTATPSPTGTATPSSTPGVTSTPTLTITPSATLSPTVAYTPSPTNTLPPTATLAPTRTSTPTSTVPPSSTPTRTSTAVSAPVAAFTAYPVSGVAPLTVVFFDRSTGAITSYAWNFGDGIGFGNQPNPAYTYATPGTFVVTLTVFGPGGSTSTSATVAVSSPPPTAAFVPNPASGLAPLTVGFFNLSTGAITSYAWNFGDGMGFSNQSNPVYTYANPGNFVVTLTVFGPGGSGFASALINVYAPPSPPTATRTPTRTPTSTATFTPTATDTPSSPTADLAVSKSVSNPAPGEGSIITYTITLVNNGPDAASGVQVTDALPGGVTYISNAPSQGTYQSGTGVWDVGPLPMGTSVTLDLVARVNLGTMGSAITNTATITAANETDPNGGNNVAGATIIIPSGAEPNIGSPNGANIVLLCGQSRFVSLGGTPLVTHGGYDLVYYEIEDSSHPGFVQMNSVIVELAAAPGGPWHQVFYWGNNILDANTSLGAAGYGAGSEPDAQLIPMTDPPLYGSVITSGVAIDVDAVAPPGTYTWVHISVPPTNCSDTEVDALEILPSLSADLAVSKSVDNPTPSETQSITYTVTLTNNGPNTATGIQVTDVLPPGLTYVSSLPSRGTYNPGSGVWSIGSLANGASGQLQIVAMVNAGTGGSTITNTASVTAAGQPDPNSGNNSASASLIVQNLSADLALSKLVDNPTPAEGDPITFTVTVTNNGPDGASGVVISDPLPGSLTLTGGAASQGTYGGGVWTVGALSGGGTATLTLTAQVNAGTGGSTITNTASITAAGQLDPNPGNNSASASVTVRARPVANDDSAATPPDTPVIIDVLANDSDLDGNLDPGSVSVTAGPTNGSIISIDPSTGAITYQPNAAFTGGDNFTYQVCDTTALCASATVTVTVG